MDRLRVSAFALLAIVLLAGTALDPLRAGQTAPAPANGLIWGRVVEGGTTTPVPGAVVTLITPASGGNRGEPAREVIADAQGRFVFSGLRPAEFILQASRPGWRGGAFGSDGPVQGLNSGEVLSRISLNAGERKELNVPIWRNAIVSGTATDETGAPLAGARVDAMRWILVGTRRRLGGSGGATTDDRGRFTMSVTPGDVMIVASSDQVRVGTGAGGGPARRLVFRETFFPDSPTSAGATMFTLRAGEERSGIEMRLPLQPAVRVTGVLNARDPGRVPPRIVLQPIGETARLCCATAVDAQGRFAFDNIAAGQYVVQTLSMQGGVSPADELWAYAAVDVGQQDVDLSVDLHRKLLVSGQVQFDGAAPPPSDPRITVNTNLRRDTELPSDVINLGDPIGPDGRFTIATVPGSFIISAMSGLTDPRGSGVPPEALRAARAFTLRSAMSGGRDVADRPLVVRENVSDLVLTLTDRRPVLRGRVTNLTASAGGAYLFVYPADESLWVDYGYGRRVKIARLRESAFEFTDLPEGDYLLAAVKSPATDRELRNPAFLGALAASARRVALREGETRVQDLELTNALPLDAALAPPTFPFRAFETALAREMPATAIPAGATLSGIVLDAATKLPIAAARVALTTNAALPGSAYTDQQGRFTLTDVPAGQHTVYVSNPSYMNTAYGATRPGEPGTPITVAAGARIDDLAVALIKGGAIGGTVVDQNGEPMANVQVNVQAYRWQARGRELVVSRTPGSLGPATTGPRGEYRVYRLAPGDYIVQVTPQGGVTTAMPLTTPALLRQASAEQASALREAAAATAEQVMVSYAPLFYPNTIDPAAAQIVTLKPGDDRTIDFQFSLIPTGTVSGVAWTPDGGPATGVYLTLTPNDPLGPGTGRRASGTVDATGAFTIRGVPPGRYRLGTSPVTARAVGGSTDILVNGDVAGIVLNLTPSARVSGQIRGDATAAAWPPNVRVSLTSLDRGVMQSTMTTSIAADNRFSFPDVPRGRYRLELTAPVNVVKPRIASQIVAGQETIDTDLAIAGGEQLEIDVRVTMTEARVAGAVRDRAGRPITGGYVVLFARESAAWTPPSRRVFGVRPDQNGRYAFPDVPPGDYLIATLSDIEPGEWFNPELLGRLVATAARLTIRAADALEFDIAQ